jgi:Endonuclease/Exonuclease/phosphatase family
MKLLIWNIQHGGGARMARIVEEIAAHDPDVIALTEYRAKPGVALCAGLRDRGWRTWVERRRPEIRRSA